MHSSHPRSKLRLNKSFLEKTDARQELADCLRLIDVSAFRPGGHIELVMDDEKGIALAYLVVE